MATNKRSTPLFPDVTEQWPAFLPVPPAIGADEDRSEPPRLLPTDEPTSQAVDETDTAPIADTAGMDELHRTPSWRELTEAVEAVRDVGYDVDSLDMPDPLDAATHLADPTTIDGPDPDPDPLADAPDWVRAHIPRVGLDLPDRRRRGVTPRRPRRPAAVSKQSSTASDDTVAPPATEVDDLTVAAVSAPAPVPAATGRRHTRLRVGLSVAAAAAAAVGVGVLIASLGPAGPDQAGEVPPLPSSQPTPRSTAAAPAPAPWCQAMASPVKTVGRGPGDLATGPGLIQAFDYAYYVERDAAKVASMMLQPNPIPQIQAGIDAAGKAGTEHCVTITPAALPNVFDVALLLRSNGEVDGVVKQLITLADAGSGLKIATLEEIR